QRPGEAIDAGHRHAHGVGELVDGHGRHPELVRQHVFGQLELGRAERGLRPRDAIGDRRGGAGAAGGSHGTADGQGGDPGMKTDLHRIVDKKINFHDRVYPNPQQGRRRKRRRPARWRGVKMHTLHTRAPARAGARTSERANDQAACTADTSNLARVLACTSSTVTPGASSVSFRPSSVTSITPRSVMMRSTTPTPVSGSVHSGSSLISSVPSFFLATCSISTTTRPTPATRSMAPPMPLTILPGIIQLARSPFSETCMAPRMARLILPPRIIANESADEKNDEPGSVVTVCLPALIRSGSTSSSVGNGPMPSSPFSDCSQTSMPAGPWLATSGCRPMPRLT